MTDALTARHLASSEGCFSVVDWLIKSKADVNVIDRFNHTPLEDAVRGDHLEVAKLLMAAGGMVMYQGKVPPLLLSLNLGSYPFATTHVCHWL
jgi:ankyrin repeat protein